MTLRRAQHAEVVFAEADAFAGRGLAGDGEVGIRAANDEPRFKRDQAGDVEDDGARAGLLDGVAQAARAAVVQIGDIENAPAASAAGESPVTFRGGEGWQEVRTAGLCLTCDPKNRKEYQQDLVFHQERNELLAQYSVRGKEKRRGPAIAVPRREASIIEPASDSDRSRINDTEENRVRHRPVVGRAERLR